MSDILLCSLLLLSFEAIPLVFMTVIHLACKMPLVFMTAIHLTCKVFCDVQAREREGLTDPHSNSGK
jgi:hypothetical protein